ncbi:dystroglycan-like [Dorcoceras hygrometricum]|uniref:Dystroglycan-like n=1 Tax=Dorcoceras hygrometricum TaxID=472368 RepID=A0A2Z7DF78_9LAMI|nr:dystroglycan-like [Dorcoceras hygrometricum]
MAASFYSNSVHVDFDSILAMDEPGMVSMFQALVASGLQGFLGCSAVVYEEALVEFFASGHVRDGLVVSSVNGVIVEISEKLFAEMFDLPVVGLADVSEMPKDKIFDARSIVSVTGEPVLLSGSKSQMKMPFRLLCDILAKSISVKAGSFNALTVEKFSLLTAVVCGVKMNWGSVLFGILKKMVTPGSKQAKGTVLVWKFLEAWRANFAPGQGSSAVDIQVIELLSDLYLCLLEELAKEARNHCLTWRKPCCSKIFEGSPRDRGAIIARNNTHTPSRCWIRTMLYVNGEWVVEPCTDRWVNIPKLVISTEVPHQRQYDDTLPTMSVFFKLMTKRWADVCLEIVGFCVSQRLLPVGSIQFCRSLQLAEPVSRIAPSRSPVFALRVSQFCSIFVDMSLFNWFPSAEITEFISEIALDRTVLRSVQSFQNSFSVAPSVQLSLEQQQSSSSSSSSSSLLHFDKTDVDATASSVPPVSQDLSAAFADLQANLLEQIFEYQNGLSSKLHKIEQSVCDSLRDQADIFRNLSQGARQEVRTLDDVQSIRFNEFRKNVLAQNDSIFQGLADVRHEVQAVNAKVDIMASRLNAIQKDAEATKEALSHQLLEFQSQAQENHNVIHAQQSELVDYIHRGSADKKGESGSRGLQQPANVQIEGSAVTPTFEQRVEMAQRRIVHTVLDADRDAAERDRERRRREARALKRRRRD